MLTGASAEIPREFTFYLNDHLGSARMVIDTSGTVKDNYDYYAFGEALNQSVSTGQSYRYTGKPFDNDRSLSLTYYGARYYDATTGQFTSVDPRTAESPSWSPYVYTADNPQKYVDPNGEFLHVVIAGALGAVAGMVGQAIQGKELTVSGLISDGLTGIGAGVAGPAAGKLVEQAVAKEVITGQTAVVTEKVAQPVARTVVKKAVKAVVGPVLPDDDQTTETQPDPQQNDGQELQPNP